MHLSKPSTFVWVLALILAALAIAVKYVSVPVVGGFVVKYDFWVMTAAYGLLLIGTLFKKL